MERRREQAKSIVLAKLERLLLTCR